MCDVAVTFYFVLTYCFIFLWIPERNAPLPGALKNNDSSFFNAYKEALYVFVINGVVSVLYARFSFSFFFSFFSFMLVDTTLDDSTH